MQVNAITHQISLAAGLGIIIYAGLASGDDWKEFYQYYRESKFIHITSLDFTLLSAFAPFWVYNDMTARKWYDKGSWLLPLSLVPFLGPALYLLLRPSLSAMPVSLSPSSSEQKWTSYLQTSVQHSEGIKAPIPIPRRVWLKLIRKILKSHC